MPRKNLSCATDQLLTLVGVFGAGSFFTYTTMPTVCELGRRWGVRHQYVSKLVRNGCPIDSYPGAAAWRENYASAKLSTHPKRIAQFIGEEPQVDSSRVRRARWKNLHLKMEREMPLRSDPIELILHSEI